MLKTIIHCTFIFPILLVCLEGCGNNNSDNPRTSAIQKHGRYMSGEILTEGAADRGLYVVDTQNPGSIQVIQGSGISYFMDYFREVYDNIEQKWIASHPAYVFYIYNHRAWRVALEDGSDLRPQAITPITNVVCKAGYMLSKHNVLESPILITSAGPDADCNLVADNEYKIIKLGNNPDIPVIDVGGVNNSSNIIARQDGFVVVQDLTLRFYDANFSHPKDLMTLTEFYYLQDLNYFGGSEFFLLNNELRKLNSDFSLRAPLWTSTETVTRFRCNEIDCILVAHSGNSQFSFSRIPLNGSSAAVSILENFNATTVGRLRLSSNYLFFEDVDAQNNIMTLYRLPLYPSNRELPQKVDSGERISQLYVRNERLFYTIVNTSSTTLVITDVDLQNRQLLANHYPIGMKDDELSLGQAGELYYAEGVADVATNLGGSTIKAYSLVDGSYKFTIGTIPNNINTLYIASKASFVNGRWFAHATIPSGLMTSGEQEDIFVIDPQAENLFVNLSNSAALNEFVY